MAVKCTLGQIGNKTATIWYPLGIEYLKNGWKHHAAPFIAIWDIPCAISGDSFGPGQVRSRSYAVIKETTPGQIRTRSYIWRRYGPHRGWIWLLMVIGGWSPCLVTFYDHTRSRSRSVTCDDLLYSFAVWGLSLSWIRISLSFWTQNIAFKPLSVSNWPLIQNARGPLSGGYNRRGLSTTHVSMLAVLTCP